MIPDSITKALDSIEGEVHRSESEIDDVNRNLKLLNIDSREQIGDFFMRYNLCGVISKRNIELLDICFPDDEIYETTEWAKDIYGLGDQFICLSSGEGEGFILFSKKDLKIYDVSVADFDDLNSGKIEPRWNSFYELINWYLAENSK